AAAAAAAALVWVWQGRAELEDAADEAERHLTSLRGADTARADCVRALDALRDDVALHRDAVALLAEPTTRVVAFAPQPGKASYRASAIVGAGEHGRAIVLASAVARASGKAYQLWVIRGKAPPVPAGFLRVLDGGGHGGGTGMAIGEIDPAVLGAGPADAFAVSLEPDGGSESPTEVLLVGALKG
ncbi:MAG TPA: anti-sigma factor, partial [Myxococcota bacterium]|nr:anti-sigma factor [Myxococcota bacterium]